ncbi:MAG: PHP domain-containing protein [Candidatus Saganbacteria bacterium]|nr:PHP domain-containing protein [Candidatus Saganbacteria bacterium]
MPKLVCDLHVHTVSSGHAYSTIEEYVAYAKKIHLPAFAVTDHGPNMPGAPHRYHFSNLRMVPEYLNGIRIFRGAEANIINEKGEIDLAEDAQKLLDFILVTFHPYCGYENQGEEKNTDVLIKAIQNPAIKTIAHPENPMYPVNVEAVVTAARKRGVFIEINNSSFTGSRKGGESKSLEFAKEVKKQGWKVTIGSDAHISTMLGTFSEALKVAKLAGLDTSDIVNSSRKNMRKFLGLEI